MSSEVLMRSALFLLRAGQVGRVATAELTVLPLSGEHQDVLLDFAHREYSVAQYRPVTALSHAVDDESSHSAVPRTAARFVITPSTLTPRASRSSKALAMPVHSSK